MKMCVVCVFSWLNYHFGIDDRQRFNVCHIFIQFGSYKRTHTCMHTRHTYATHHIHIAVNVSALTFFHSCVIVRAKRFCRYFVFFCSHSVCVECESVVGLRLHSNVCASDSLVPLFRSTTFQIVMIEFRLNFFFFSSSVIFAYMS